MRQIPLYSGNGASLSPNGEGRTLSAYVRLVADDGMILKNGELETSVIDILASTTSEWEEISAPDSEPTVEDKAEAYDILIGGAAE